MSSRLLVAVVAIAAAIYAPVDARAARPANATRIKAAAAIEWRGRWSPEEREPIEAALAAALDEAGLDVVTAPAARGRFDVDARFQGCFSTDTCRFEYGRTAGAAFFFVVVVVRQGKNVRVAMNLYDVKLLAQHFVGRPSPGRARPAAVVRRLVADLLEVERRSPRGTLEVATAPPGDAVFIDGHAVGLTNLTQTLLAGPHLLRIERRGAAPHIARVNVVAAQPLRYEARFEKQVVPTE